MEANTTACCVKRVLKGGRERGAASGAGRLFCRALARFRERPAVNAGMATGKALRMGPRGRRLLGDGCTGTSPGLEVKLKAARRRGLAAHERFEQEGLAARAVGSRQVGRCFVASLLFGEAWQTQVLRQFRDNVLRPRGWGRGLIRLYYRGAPRVCVAQGRWPALRRPVRAALGILAAGVRLILGGEAPR